MGVDSERPLPRVSICLPNLNNRKFLEERLGTIYSQTYTDWELIVSDNYSQDGAWELFQDHVQKEPRMRISQAPRAGMYENWNNCVKRAQGEYIYIATSDDTMPPDCIGSLVKALDTHSECDLAHCRLRVIDQAGDLASDNWWPRTSIFSKSSGDLLNRMHVRNAPFDGLLHLIGHSVYISTTQLLIRRSVFAKIGLFESRWGSIGDFAWNMLAGLVVNTVHVPSTWGGWRIHPHQATAAAGLGGVDHQKKIDEMIDDTFRKSENVNSRVELRGLRLEWEAYFRELREFSSVLRNTKGFIERQAYVLRNIVMGSRVAGRHLRSRLRWQRGNWEAALIEDIRASVERAIERPVLIPD